MCCVYPMVLAYDLFFSFYFFSFFSLHPTDSNHNPFAWTVVVAENDRARLEGQEKIVKVCVYY